MQLFTENTIKAVCPVLDEFSGRMILRVLRLWGLVLGANLAGYLKVADAMVALGVI